MFLHLIFEIDNHYQYSYRRQADDDDNGIINKISQEV